MAADMAPGRVVPLFPSTRDVSSLCRRCRWTGRPLPLRILRVGRGAPVRRGRHTRDGGHRHRAGRRAGRPLPDAGLGGTCPGVLRGEHLSAVVVNLFGLRRPADRAPRVDIGSVTVCRATWRVPLVRLAEMAGRDKDPAQQALRDWLTGLEVTHVFAGCRSDRKPVYVDLAAPPGRQPGSRRPTGTRLSPSRSWWSWWRWCRTRPGWLRLPDSSYTSELRLVVRGPSARDRRLLAPGHGGGRSC